jgi:SAM-dependent methyltransferase
LGLIVGNHLVPAKLWTLAAGQASSWTPSQNAAGIVPESTQQRLPSSHGIECSTPFLKLRQFSLISALHVLEHVDGQVDLLRKFRGCLHEDGILLIAVPSFHELPKHTRKHYCINYPNHIVALTDRAIETILAMAGFDLLSGTANVWANSYLVAARRSATAAAKISRKPLSAAIAALKDSKTGDIRSGWLWRRLPIRYRAARMNAFYTGKIKRRRERKARRQQEAAEIVPRA